MPMRLRSIHFRAFALVVAIFALTSQCALADTWSEHSYAPYGFALSSASDPTVATLHSWSWPLSSQIAVVVLVNDYPANSVVDLDGALAGAVKNLPGGRVVSKKRIVLQGVGGLEADLSGDSADVHLRFFSQGQRLWQILSVNSPGQVSAEAQRISTSFRFTP
jgi:hypothetical protein